MIYTYVLAAIVSAALSGWGVWNVQNWRYGAKEAERLEQVRETEKFNRQIENRQSGNVIGALNAANQRAKDSAVAAADASAAVDGLRNELDRIKRGLPGTTLDACRHDAAALATVFAQCSKEYSAMGGHAQGHADDTLTLEQAWPK